MNFRNMNKEEIILGERALNHLLLGLHIYGMNFTIPHLYIMDFAEPRKHEVFLRMESKWTIYDTRPKSFPSSADEMDNFGEDEIIAIWTLAKDKTRIERAELGQDAPHLILTFDNGQVFFHNGHHMKYESWEISTKKDDYNWTLVAVPGDGLAMWVPDDFIQG